MRRIFGSYAYSDGPRSGCWWDETRDLPQRPAAEGDLQFDVAIVGAGFTGLSAALHLAEAGLRVAVLEARHVGWGASGRNGGFCCLGGGLAGNDALEKRFGEAGRAAYRKAELAAIHLVSCLIDRLDLDVDRHSDGETALAHRSGDMDDLRARADTVRRDYNVDADLVGQADLGAQGLLGPFFGALHVRAGFGLNPRKYVAGLAEAAERAGAVIFKRSPIDRMSHRRDGHLLHSGGTRVRADRVIVATNGYSSETLPDWLRGRYLPSQSNVLVTRPLTDREITAQGWSSDQMAYDTRRLLHYFRLMPDRRFLFGMRGGVLSGAAAEGRARAATRRHFETMFPSWKGVESAHGWSGMVSLARNGLPFVGAVPGTKGIFAGLCYHGNGVGMGSYAGALLADLVQEKTPDHLYPLAIAQPLRRFELGPVRRLVVPGAYLAFMLADR